MEKIKILVVDDDPDLIKAITVILENQQYQVVTASNRKEGLEKIKAEKPDLAILDVMMDDTQDGFRMAREIRTYAEFKKLPILLLTAIDKVTGVNFKSVAGEATLLPVDGYIHKPISPHELISEINRLLQKKT